MLRILVTLALAAPAHAWVVTPRLGVGVALEDTEAGWHAAHVPIALGVAVQPAGSRWVAPFVSPQVDIEVPAEGEGVSYVPTLRVGVLAREETPEYVSALLPWLQLYLVVGWRLPGGPQAAGSRVGVGVASPIGLIVSLRALEAGVPIPNSAEFVVDGLESLDPVGVFRFGFSL